MINRSNIADSLARVALSSSNKPKIDLALDVVSHIAGKVALQVIDSLLEQKGRLGEHQQRGLSVVLDALCGKEAVSDVETHAGGGRFNLARAAYDVASVVWERDASMPKVMSFLGIIDSTGNTLFSLGKELADALATRLPEQRKNNGVATSARNAFPLSKLNLSKVMQDISGQVLNATRQQDKSAALASSSGLPPEVADIQADAGPRSRASGEPSRPSRGSAPQPQQARAESAPSPSPKEFKAGGGQPPA